MARSTLYYNLAVKQTFPMWVTAAEKIPPHLLPQPVVDDYVELVRIHSVERMKFLSSRLRKEGEYAREVANHQIQACSTILSLEEDKSVSPSSSTIVKRWIDRGSVRNCPSRRPQLPPISRKKFSMPYSKKTLMVPGSALRLGGVTKKTTEAGAAAPEGPATLPGTAMAPTRAHPRETWEEPATTSSTKAHMREALLNTIEAPLTFHEALPPVTRVPTISRGALCNIHEALPHHPGAPPNTSKAQPDPKDRRTTSAIKTIATSANIMALPKLPTRTPELRQLRGLLNKKRPHHPVDQIRDNEQYTHYVNLQCLGLWGHVYPCCKFSCV